VSINDLQELLILDFLSVSVPTAWERTNLLDQWRFRGKPAHANSMRVRRGPKAEGGWTLFNPSRKEQSAITGAQ